MQKNKQSTLLIINALAWASVMLATSYFTRGSLDPNTSNTILMFQIAGWITVNGLLTANAGSVRKEWACIKRRLSNTDAK